MLTMKNKGRLTDSSIAYYKKWQFYVLVPASLFSFLVVALNLLAIRSISVIGMFLWILFAVVLITASSMLMHTPTTKTRNYVIVATIFGVFIDLSVVFGIISAIVNG